MNKLFINKSWQNVKRAGWRTYAVIFMMTVTYLIFGVLMVTAFTSKNLAGYLSQRPEVIGFFKDEVKEEQILDLKRELESLDYIAEVRYVSKEEAMESFLKENEDNKEITEAVTVNPFPSHLNVRVKNLDNISAISDFFESSELISDVKAYEKILDTLRTIVFAVQIIGLSLFIIFTFSTILIIFLTVGITIYARKSEIIVMKLVGATDWFVSAPYLLQSLFYSFVSVILASMILAPILIIKYNGVVASVVGDLGLYYLNVPLVLVGVGIELLFGVLLAFLSSYFATKRYINY